MKKIIKKLVKKYLQKYVGREMAAFDSRIYDLEVKAGIKFFEIRPDTLSKAITGDIAVKDAEYISAVSKTEITELPEKWCIRITDENKDALHEYWLKLDSDKDYPFIEWLLSDSYHDGSYLSYSEGSLNKIGYTEISFSDFERLVLKKEQSGKSEQLVVGEWYKERRPINGVESYLICLTKFDDLGVEGYGFLDAEWFGNGNNYLSNLEPATKEEVEAALIAEAAKRGFRDGVGYISAATGSTFTSSKNFRFGSNETETRLLCGEGCIFYNGIWAEIISQPEENIQEVDFETLDIKTAFELASDILKHGITSLDFLNENEVGKANLKETIAQRINHILRHTQV